VGREAASSTRLVIETPVDRPPCNAVLRFHDEGDRPLRDQAEALLAPMMERGVTPIWLVLPTTDPAITDALVEIGLDRAEELFGMAADLADIPPPGEVPEGVEVVELTLDESHVWLELVSWRYGLGEESSAYLIEAYRSSLDERTRVWVAMVTGVERTVLHSTPMARSLYERMGYEDVATFEVWAAPDSVHL
jgi:hypothetical protein